jgi:hypothetical protein
MLIIKLLKPKGYKTSMQSYAVCQNCGYSWEVKKGGKITRAAKITLTICFGILFLLCLIGGIFSKSATTTSDATTDPNAIYTQVAATIYAEISTNTPEPINIDTQKPYSLTHVYQKTMNGKKRQLFPLQMVIRYALISMEKTFQYAI